MFLGSGGLGASGSAGTKADSPFSGLHCLWPLQLRSSISCWCMEFRALRCSVLTAFISCGHIEDNIVLDPGGYFANYHNKEDLAWKSPQQESLPEIIRIPYETYFEGSRTWWIWKYRHACLCRVVQVCVVYMRE